MNSPKLQSPKSPKSPRNTAKANSKLTPKNSPSVSPKKSPNELKIQELQLLHKNAINRLDFMEASNIDKQISELKSQSKKDQLSIIKSEFNNIIKKCVVSYKDNLEKLQQSQETDKINFRVQINSIFENLQTKQMNEMSELEKAYASDRLKEFQRNLPEYDNFILRAKSAGALHDYEAALEFQNSASLVSQSYLDKRFALIDKDYEAKNDALLQKHTREVALLVKRLEDGLKKISDKSILDLNQEKINFDSKLINEYKKVSRKIQLQTTDVSAHLKDIDLIMSQVLSENSLEIPKTLCESLKNLKAPLMFSQNLPK